MKKYIFITSEGITYAPNSDFIVENMQVIGIVEGVKNEQEGIKKLLKENVWLKNAGFNIEEFKAFQIL